jgi:hypothetical protein
MMAKTMLLKRATRPVQDQHPEWLKDMRAHYNETGFYRAEDIQRVLGDPRDGVGMTVSTELAAAARIQKK